MSNAYSGRHKLSLWRFFLIIMQLFPASEHLMNETTIFPS